MLPYQEVTLSINFNKDQSQLGNMLRVINLNTEKMLDMKIESHSQDMRTYKDWIGDVIISMFNKVEHKLDGELIRGTIRISASATVIPNE